MWHDGNESEAWALYFLRNRNMLKIIRVNELDKAHFEMSAFSTQKKYSSTLVLADECPQLLHVPFSAQVHSKID
jgi:hypothetical protein